MIRQFQRGQVVIVKAGRDSAQAMVVLTTEGEYLYLADGRRRKIAKPKKKKAMHVQPVKAVISLIPACGRALQDADIRKALKDFNKCA